MNSVESTTIAGTTFTSAINFTYDTSTVANTTASPGKTMNAVSVFGIAVAVIAILLIIISIVILFAKCKYSKWLLTIRKRRSSSSHQRLHSEGAEDELPRRRSASELFSVVDEDSDLRGGGAGPDDGYFYDEIYERSAFVDETTNTSMKELRTLSPEEIPDLIFRNDR